MEKISLLVMVRLMLTNEGFTLIETLFVLFIIIILSTLSLSIHQPEKSSEAFLNELQSFLNEARLKAITTKQNVSVYFETDKIIYATLDNEWEYVLPSDSEFEQYDLSYNENGHIHNAKSISFEYQQKNYQLVYQVGSGSFYVQ